MFSNGMDAKGKKCSSLHDQASERTGLPVQVVKDWIGNKNKVVEGRTKPQNSKTIYIKGMTAYNCFVREKKEEFSDIKEWAPAWNTLADEEKQLYKEKAKEATRSCQGSVKDIPRRLKSLNKQCIIQLAELADLGVDLAAVGVDSNDGRKIISGPGKSALFFMNRPNITNELYVHLSQEMGKDDAVDQDTCKNLRVKAQKHMNHLYSQACGKEEKFPYKKVRDGNIQIKGFPERIMPIRTVSNYGEDKLKLILSVKEISIETVVEPVVEPEPLVAPVVPVTGASLMSFVEQTMDDAVVEPEPLLAPVVPVTGASLMSIVEQTMDDALAAPEIPSDLVDGLGVLLNVFQSEESSLDNSQNDTPRKRTATESLAQVTEKTDVKKRKHKEGTKEKK